MLNPTLRRGGAEVAVGGLATSGTGPVTYTFDAAGNAFTSDTERLSAGGLVEVVAGLGKLDAVAFVMAKKT